MNEIIEKLAVLERYALLAAKRVLNIEEAAILTGLSADTLRRKVGARELAAFRPSGKQLFFAKEELEAWMLRGRISPRDEVLQGASTHIFNKGKKSVKI